MKNIKILLILPISILFLGCSIKTPEVKIVERDNVNVLSNTSDLQMTFLKKQGELERYCGSRQSDVADTRSSGTTIGGSALGDSGNVGEGNSEGALSLGGRNPAVLIVREMLYRACELSMNLNADQKTSIEIYSKFLDSIEKITATQTGVGAASLGQKANSTVTLEQKDDSTQTSESKNDKSSNTSISNSDDSSSDTSNDDSDEDTDSDD